MHTSGSNTSTYSVMMDYLVGGVDQSLAGNGGPACSSFRSDQRKALETFFFGVIIYTLLQMTHQKVQEQIKKSASFSHLHLSRQMVLISFCLMFGIQVGYKIATKTLIFLLQPCHVVTSVQIYLLAAPVQKYTSLIFRVHIGLLNGPLLAVLFPVLDTYSLPFEIEMYWIQHLSILLVPFYLYRLGDPYENPTQIPYSILSYIVFLFYHIFIIQPVAVASGVNVSTILCPAPTDPFYGANYLLHAAWHQALVIYGVVTLYSLVLPCFTRPAIKQS